MKDTPDYGRLIRERALYGHYEVCLDPTLVRTLSYVTEGTETHADLLEQIIAKTVVVRFRALPEEFTATKQVEYQARPASEARMLNRDLTVASFDRFETRDGDEIEDLGRADLEVLFDGMNQAEKASMTAIVLELALNPIRVPSSALRSQKTTG